MKRLSILVLLGALTTAGSVAATGSFSLNQFNSQILPVLVQVNANGKVTRVSPSIRLRAQYERLLRKNIQEVVSGPAMERQKAVSSQFVMNVMLKAAPLNDGTYDAQFAYVSSQPIPSGPMHWVSLDGHRLALQRDSNSQSNRFDRSLGFDRVLNNSAYGNYNTRPPSPVFNSHVPSPTQQQADRNKGGH